MKIVFFLQYFHGRYPHPLLQQPVHEICTKKADICLTLMLYPQLLFLKLQPLLDTLFKLLQCGCQLYFINRFEQIIPHTKLNGGLRIGKLGISADNNNLKILYTLFHIFYQIQAITARHPDVCYQNIGLNLLYHLTGFQSIMGNSRHFHMQ